MISAIFPDEPAIFLDPSVKMGVFPDEPPIFLDPSVKMGVFPDERSEPTASAGKPLPGGGVT